MQAEIKYFLRNLMGVITYKFRSSLTFPSFVNWFHSPTVPEQKLIIMEQPLVSRSYWIIMIVIALAVTIGNVTSLHHCTCRFIIDCPSGIALENNLSPCESSDMIRCCTPSMRGDAKFAVRSTRGAAYGILPFLENLFHPKNPSDLITLENLGTIEPYDKFKKMLKELVLKKIEMDIPRTTNVVRDDTLPIKITPISSTKSVYKDATTEAHSFTMAFAKTEMLHEGSITDDDSRILKREIHLDDSTKRLPNTPRLTNDGLDYEQSRVSLPLVLQVKPMENLDILKSRLETIQLESNARFTITTDLPEPFIKKGNKINSEMNEALSPTLDTLEVTEAEADLNRAAINKSSQSIENVDETSVSYEKQLIVSSSPNTLPAETVNSFQQKATSEVSSELDGVNMQSPINKSTTTNKPGVSNATTIANTKRPFSPSSGKIKQHLNHVDSTQNKRRYGASRRRQFSRVESTTFTPASSRKHLGLFTGDEQSIMHATRAKTPKYILSTERTSYKNKHRDNIARNESARTSFQANRSELKVQAEKIMPAVQNLKGDAAQVTANTSTRTFRLPPRRLFTRPIEVPRQEVRKFTGINHSRRPPSHFHFSNEIKNKIQSRINNRQHTASGISTTSPAYKSLMYTRKDEKTTEENTISNNSTNHGKGDSSGLQEMQQFASLTSVTTSSQEPVRMETTSTVGQSSTVENKFNAPSETVMLVVTE